MGGHEKLADGDVSLSQYNTSRSLSLFAQNALRGRTIAGKSRNPTEGVEGVDIELYCGIHTTATKKTYDREDAYQFTFKMERFAIVIALAGTLTRPLCDSWPIV